MYSIKIFDSDKIRVIDVVTGNTFKELSDRYYLYNRMHAGGFYFTMYVNNEMASREIFNGWVDFYNKFLKEISRLKKIKEDF